MSRSSSSSSGTQRDHVDLRDPLDRLAAAILDLLASRTGTICPSEAARRVSGDDTWRELMQPAREAAARLVAAGLVEVTQGGEVVDVTAATGPVRIQRAGPEGR